MKKITASFLALAVSWVLWGEMTLDGSTSSWRRIGPTQISRQMCNLALSRTLETMLHDREMVRRGWSLKKVGPKTMSITKSGQTGTYIYHCLPDTIDPR